VPTVVLVLPVLYLFAFGVLAVAATFATLAAFRFAQIAWRRGVTEEEAVEMIDVGGPAMLRAAAKNYAHVTPVCRPDQYEDVLAELRATGELSLETRRHLPRLDVLRAANRAVETVPAQMVERREHGLHRVRPGALDAYAWARTVESLAATPAGPLRGPVAVGDLVTTALLPTAP